MFVSDKLQNISINGPCACGPCDTHKIGAKLLQMTNVSVGLTTISLDQIEDVTGISVSVRFLNRTPFTAGFADFCAWIAHRTNVNLQLSIVLCIGMSSE